MNSAALKTLPFLLLRPPSRTFTHLKRTQLMISTCNTNPDLKSDTKTSNLSVPRFAKTETPVATANFYCSATQDPVSVRLQRLVVEFKSLTEPIDRVKRLLDYAARLPPFDESARLPENRVVGCTTQVWVEVKMDENGRMRFRADSDSEITKGFLSCLTWLLDGATAEEVMAVQEEELEAVNVGLHGRVQSRVNTWHNILTSMQKRTESLVAEQIGRSPEGQLIPLIVDGLGDDGSLNDTQVQVFKAIQMARVGRQLVKAIKRLTFLFMRAIRYCVCQAFKAGYSSLGFRPLANIGCQLVLRARNVRPRKRIVMVDKVM